MAAQVLSHQNFRLAKAAGQASPVAPTWVGQWQRIFQAAFTGLSKAHARRHELASLPKDIQRDTGLSPEEATGISSFQPDLPFFLQRGFGHR